MTAPDQPEPICGPSCTPDCGMGHCYLTDGPYRDPEHAASPAATGSNRQDLAHQQIGDLDFTTCGRCNARYCPCRAETHEGGHCRGGAK